MSSLDSDLLKRFLFENFDMLEGDLSQTRAKIVGRENLSNVISNLNLDKFLKVFPENLNISSNMKCDLYEAILGAIFLDGGIDNAKTFFNKALGEKLLNIKINGYVDDPKTKLQEMLKQAKIVYQTSKSGADHMPTYKSNVYINDVKMGKGKGSNKRAAEEMAASNAINNLKQV